MSPLLLAVSARTHACSGCFIGDGGEPWAYSVATVIMLALPLVMVVVLGLYVRQLDLE